MLVKKNCQAVPDHIVTRLQAAAESTKPEFISAKEVHANGE